MVIAGRRLDKGKEAEQDLQAAGGRVLFVQADVSQSAQVAACLRATSSDSAASTTLSTMLRPSISSDGRKIFRKRTLISKSAAI